MAEYSTYIVSNQAIDLNGGKFYKELSNTYYSPEEINEIYIKHSAKPFLQEKLYILKILKFKLIIMNSF